MAFLDRYTNQEREAIASSDKNKLYPIGQVMPIGYWDCSTAARINIIADNGFTMYGPNYGNHDEAGLAQAKVRGLRANIRIYLGARGTPYGTACEAWSNDPEHTEYIFTKMENTIKEYMNNPTYNDVTDYWQIPPEEMGARMYYPDSTYPGNQCSEAGCVAYTKRVRNLVNSIDPQKRPTWESDISDTSVSAYKILGKYREGYSIQRYPEDRYGLNTMNPSISGYPFRVTQPLIYRTVQARLEQTFDSSVYVNRRGLTVPILGNLANLGGGSTPTKWKSYVGYMLYSSMIMGVQGYYIYRWLSDQDTTNKAEARTAWLSETKIFTDDGFDQAFLWGKRMAGQTNGLTFTKISGPANADYYQSFSSGGGNLWEIDAEMYIDIQFGDFRYIALTNVHPTQNVVMDIRGLPIGETIKDCKTGNSTVISSTTKRITIGKENYLIYKIGTIVAPSTPTAPTFSPNNVDPGDTVTLSATTTGATSVQWQRKRSGGSWSNI